MMYLLLGLIMCYLLVLAFLCSVLYLNLLLYIFFNDKRRHSIASSNVKDIKTNINKKTMSCCARTSNENGPRLLNRFCK